MVLSAPFLMFRLGADQYGVWMLASAVGGTLGVFHAGLGEATIKYVSSYKGRNDLHGVARVVSGTIALGTILGTIAAAVVVLSSSFLVHRVFKIDPSFHNAAVNAIRIAAVLLWLQSIYQVLSSTLKGLELYGPPARVSVLMRSFVIVAAVALAAGGLGVDSIMVATVVATAIGVVWLGVIVHRLMKGHRLRISINRATFREVFGFGVYSWLQNTAAVIFSQADKFLIATMLGAAPVAYYTLCVQLAQQVHALPSAGFNFLFPHISKTYEGANLRKVRRSYRLAVPVNVVVAVCLALPLIVFGRRILTIWMGQSFSTQAYPVLAILAAAFALLSVNIVPYFTLL
ncbi:MAG TPA: oligosaccharide flippase family protein, partial [Nitrospira sp.]|nr:oligosaccharide flippase family protein [Nitrospira sp.]